MTAICGTCRWWNGGEGKRNAECRRFPPTQPAPSRTLTADWLRTYYSDWCGEHQPKETQP